MTFDLSQLSVYYIVLLPGIVALVAGLLRQDRLPQGVNEAIAFVVVLLLAGVQALLGGKLGGSALSDFAIIASYAAALVHTPPLAKLQEYLQSNFFSFGSPAPAQPAVPPQAAPVQIPPPIVHIDVAALALQLSKELMKVASQQAPSPSPARPQVPDLDTVKTSTPPVQSGTWMNQGPPNRAG
jgi:hypothetical protein